MTLDTVLKTLQLAGTAAPAFKALFDQIVPLLSPADQATAQARYADAIAASDRAHVALQDMG